MREKKKNVILITVDALRADHLSALGYAEKTTPNLDKIAKEGVLFTRAFSYGSSTHTAILPMLMSSPFIPYYLHGLDGIETVSMSEGLERYREIVTKLIKLKVTIAGALREHGYETAAFHSNPYLTRYYGYGEGFSHFDDSFGKYGNGKKMMERVKVALSMSRRLENLAKRLYFLIYRNEIPYERAEVINEKAISWLKAKNPKKFFMWLHYMDTHIPYKPPKDFRPPINSLKMSELNRKILNKEDIFENELSQLIGLYDGSIRYVDYAIKHLIEELKEMKMLEGTIVFITADHGEEFKEHGDFIHRTTKLYDELIHIPLIIYNSEHRATVDAPVSPLDIAPTIMDMLNLPTVKTFQGKSLIPIIEDKRDKNFAVMSQGWDVNGLIVAYMTRKWKYILNEAKNSRELYDIEEDPEERENLYEMERAIAEDLELKILEHISHQKKVVATDMEKERIMRKIKTSFLH